MLTSLGPQVYHLTSSHLISPHLISFHVISSLHILSHLISSPLLSSPLLSSPLLSSPLLSSPLLSSPLLSSPLLSSPLLSSHLISSHLISSHLILSAKLYAYNHCIHCMQLLNTAESTIALGFLVGFASMQEIIPSPYLPVRPLMVFMAMTVEEAMPPKLKLQSLIRHELEFTCFSNNTLIAVFTMAMSSSRRRACLKAKTYSCYKKFQIQITLIIYNHSKGVRSQVQTSSIWSRAEHSLGPALLQLSLASNSIGTQNVAVALLSGLGSLNLLYFPSL